MFGCSPSVDVGLQLTNKGLSTSEFSVQFFDPSPSEDAEQLSGKT